MVFDFCQMSYDATLASLQVDKSKSKTDPTTQLSNVISCLIFYVVMIPKH